MTSLSDAVPIIGGVVLVVIALVVVPLLVVLIRSIVLHTRPGSFPAFVLKDGTWVRGIAEYGSSNLAWRRQIGFLGAPDILLARRQIDVEDTPERWYQSSLVTVTLTTPTESVSFALRSGDAAGLIAWIDSSPPGV